MVGSFVSTTSLARQHILDCLITIFVVRLIVGMLFGVHVVASALVEALDLQFEGLLHHEDNKLL